MIVYKTNLTDEGRKALVEIALESPKNIRKRKVIMPISAILAVLGIPNGLYFCINGAYSYGIVTLICSFIMLFIAFNYIAIFRIDEPHKTVYVLTIQYQGRNL